MIDNAQTFNEAKQVVYMASEDMKITDNEYDTLVDYVIDRIEVV